MYKILVTTVSDRNAVHTIVIEFDNERAAQTATNAINGNKQPIQGSPFVYRQALELWEFA